MKKRFEVKYDHIPLKLEIPEITRESVARSLMIRE